MSILQIHFENAEQWEKVLAFLKSLKLEFKVLQAEEFAEENRVHDVHEAYRASLPVFSEDWDAPENDHWDTY